MTAVHPTTPPSFRRVAYNTAATSSNKTHDDAGARELGYRAALVPGITVYAYLTELAVAAWGDEWLAHGGASLTLPRPVFEGEELLCTATPSTERDGALELMAAGAQDGTARARARVWLRMPDEALPIDRVPDPAAPTGSALPPLSAGNVPLDTPMIALLEQITPEIAARWASDAGDMGQATGGSPKHVHPAWAASRQAGLLRHNFAMGPSIHAASEIANLRPCPVTGAYETRGVIRREWERNGHHYLLMDTIVLADGEPVTAVRHTSIFQPRASAR